MLMALAGWLLTECARTHSRASKYETACECKYARTLCFGCSHDSRCECECARVRVCVKCDRVQLVRMVNYMRQLVHWTMPSITINYVGKLVGWLAGRAGEQANIVAGGGGDVVQRGRRSGVRCWCFGRCFIMCTLERSHRNTQTHKHPLTIIAIVLLTH